jgi:hypothetical protein
MAFLGWALSITVVYMIIVKPILTLYFPNLPLPELPTEVVIQLLLGMLGIAL